MDRSILPHLPAVLAVARTRSFARAAAELGMGASAVSHAVRKVEERLGEPLFARTTRSVSVTEIGAEFIGQVAHAFEEMTAAVERVSVRRGEVTGVLRLNAPRIAGPLALTAILAVLAKRHPGLTVEVTSDDALTDIVGHGFDAGVRLGEMVAEDMVAVRLTAPLKAMIAASPAYVAAHGAPATVADLAHHNCIGYRFLTSGGAYLWELLDETGRDVAVAVKGTAVVTDATYARDLALAGIGVLYGFEPLIQADLEAQTLVPLLPRAAIWESGLFAYFPRRAARAAKLRAFIDAARFVATRQAALADRGGL